MAARYTYTENLAYILGCSHAKSWMCIRGCHCHSCARWSLKTERSKSNIEKHGLGANGVTQNDPKILGMWALAEFLLTCNTGVIEESLTGAANAHIF